jgi:hypothetical protein
VRYRLADHRKRVRVHAVLKTRRISRASQITAGNMNSQTIDAWAGSLQVYQTHWRQNCAAQFTRENPPGLHGV